MARKSAISAALTPGTRVVLSSETALRGSVTAETSAPSASSPAPPPPPSPTAVSDATSNSSAGAGKAAAAFSAASSCTARASRISAGRKPGSASFLLCSSQPQPGHLSATCFTNRSSGSAVSTSSRCSNSRRRNSSSFSRASLRRSRLLRPSSSNSPSSSPLSSRNASNALNTASACSADGGPAAAAAAPSAPSPSSPGGGGGGGGGGEAEHGGLGDWRPGGEDAGEGNTVGPWKGADDIALLGLAAEYPGVDKAEVKSVYRGYRGRRDPHALTRTLYSLADAVNKDKLAQLEDQFGQSLGFDKVKGVWRKARVIRNYRKDGDWAQKELESMARGEGEGEEVEEQQGDPALAVLVEEYAPDVPRYTVHDVRCKSSRIVCKTKLYLDAWRRRNGGAPVPFVTVALEEGVDVLKTVEERDATCNAAHAPMRSLAAGADVVRDKAYKASREGQQYTSSWLHAEANDMFDEEPEGRLEIAFRLFDKEASPRFYNFITNHAAVASALSNRVARGDVGVFPRSGVDTAMFRVDLHMQRPKEVGAVLDRVVHLIVCAYPEARLEELLDLSVDVMFGKGVHSNGETGPKLPSAIGKWKGHDYFMEFCKDVVEDPQKLLFGFRFSARNLATKNDRDDVMTMFRNIRAARD